eukprot:1296083-Pyramimonas_sp.AAC.1
MPELPFRVIAYVFRIIAIVRMHLPTYLSILSGMPDMTPRYPSIPTAILPRWIADRDIHEPPQRIPRTCSSTAWANTAVLARIARHASAIREGAIMMALYNVLVWEPAT